MKNQVANRLSLSGQSLPEVLTSMLLLGILMLVAYPTMQQAMGLSSPIQQQFQMELMDQLLMEPIESAKLEREVAGRKLIREVLCLSAEEHIFQLEVSCWLDEKVWGKRQIIIQDFTLSL